MSQLRIQRVAELIKETLGDIALRAKDPRIGFFTITNVKVSPDFDVARVFVSIYGDESAHKDTLDGLQSASGFFRKELSNKIRLRRIPKIIFQFDPGIEKGVEIIKIIDQAVHHDKTGKEHENDKSDDFTKPEDQE